MKQLVCTILITGLCLGASSKDVWNQLRGPAGSGVSTDERVNVRFDKDDILWKVSLPGTGFTSPVFNGNRVFLVNATGDPMQAGTRHVLCLDADTGKTLWKHDLKFGAYKHHKANHATSSNPVVDANGVYVYWYNGKTIEAMSWTLDGKPRWKRDFGPIENRFGFGVSPTLADGLLLLPISQNLAASKLIDHRQEEVLEFTAPTQPGDYQFVCTFPGHHILMRGVMRVK